MKKWYIYNRGGKVMDYNNYGSYEERKTIPWGRIFLCLLGVVLFILLIFMFMKFCSKRSLQPDLLEAGKDYYAKNTSELPKEIGDCKSVSLKTLEEQKLIKSSNYKTCNLEATYVKVCYLESKNYHYVAILSCDKETTKFGMWQNGTEQDLIADKSDIRFGYVIEQLKLGTKYYYPKNHTDVSEVKEYYVTSPDNEYTNKEDEQIGYKWYKEVDEKQFYNSGAYTSIQPKGYINKGESKLVTNYTFNKPSSASYRKIEEVTLYRSKVEARQYKWECISKDDPTAIMVSPTICPKRDDEFTIINEDHIEYTCDGKTSVKVGTICSDFTGWTEKECKSSTVTGVVCESKAGYKYTDTQWQWYKEEKVRNYYTSGSKTSDKEQTYYINPPEAGAIKDEVTATKVYRFYKLVDDREHANLEDWIEITNGYVTKEEMISTIQQLGYEVTTLDDIKALEDIRYRMQLQYRKEEE